VEPGSGGQALETKFRNAVGRLFRDCCRDQSALAGGKRQLAALAGGQFDPSDLMFDAVESNLFNLGPLMAACPERIDEYAKLITSVRDAVKLQSRRWDVHDREVRNRLYRLLYGGRTALEEVVLQAAEDAITAVEPGTNEPSQTPSFQRAGVELHSGDLLVSRGGAPALTRAAMITRELFSLRCSTLMRTHTPPASSRHISRGRSYRRLRNISKM
jgi:hypothetical protein